jgi:hypothetical protein
MRKQQWHLAATLLLITLACGPLEELRTVNRLEQALATGTAVIHASNKLAAEAFEKIETLPGYRLETRYIVRDKTGKHTTQTSIRDYDAEGNFHILPEPDDDLQTEMYYVDGHAYMYEPEYDGWIDLGTISPVEVRRDGETALTSTDPMRHPMQLLTHFAAVPTKVGRDTLDNRAATRYDLRYVEAEIVEAFGQESTDDSSIQLRGTLWTDDETGSLLKSEILLYHQGAGLPSQEYLLQISEIGNIDPIALPSPVVDPGAIASATATAQAWTVLEVVLNFQDKQINFEAIPVRVTQVPASSPRSAEVQFMLRQLPDSIFLEANLEPFLVQLRQQLSLSIPKRNLIVTSSGFRLENSNPQNRTLDVHYFFNADLENFNHIELILAQPGNPLFAPVPVE